MDDLMARLAHSPEIVRIVRAALMHFNDMMADQIHSALAAALAKIAVGETGGTGGAAVGILEFGQPVQPAPAGAANNLAPAPYTHLTLPTHYSA